MNCIFESCGQINGKPVVCCTKPGCGNRMYSAAPEQCVAECSRKPGWGDRAAFGLERMGVTQAGYRRWKVRWGFSDACNCSERKEKLNRIGRWVAKRREALSRFGRSFWWTKSAK